MGQWDLNEIAKFMVVGTACLCLILLFLVTLLGVMNGKISVEALGGFEGVTAGSGLIGFGILLYKIIKLGLYTGGGDGRGISDAG